MREKQLPVALNGGQCPRLRHESPVVVREWVDLSCFLNFLHQVIALVALTAPDNAAVEFLLWDACSASEQFTAAVAAIAVHGYAVGLLWVEGLPIRHAEDVYFLSVGFRHVHFVVDAGSAVEVEGQVLEHEALVVVAVVVSQEHDVVVGRLHRVDPEVVAHLEVASHFFTGEQHDVYLVLVLVEIEHVGHADISLGDDGVESEWRVQ